MTSLPADLEIDRLMNLIRGFGWEMRTKEVTDDSIVLSIEKKITPEKP